MGFVALVLASTSPADACGGFTAPEPVDQSGERVLFREDGPDEWTAFVEVQYAEGTPGPLSWVIPVREPFDLETDVSLAPAGIFDALELVTAPRLSEAGQTISDAKSALSCDGAVELAKAKVAEQVDESYLLGSAKVGPYDIQKIEGGDPQLLIDWMIAQNHTVPANAYAPIQDYVDQGYSFIGVQINTDGTGGPIETLVLGCGMTEPTVPLKLTAMSAVEDMPITAYILGEARVVPTGLWSEITPDFRGVLDIGNYLDRVLEGQRDSGGRGFTTEYAAKASDLLQKLDPEVAKVLGHGKYLTRMTAFVSPEQMDDDPVFAYDYDAPDVNPVIKPGFGFSAVPTSAGALLLGLLGVGAIRRMRDTR